VETCQVLTRRSRNQRRTELIPFYNMRARSAHVTA
jgi:hypothetical protein